MTGNTVHSCCTTWRALKLGMDWTTLYLIFDQLTRTCITEARRDGSVFFTNEVAEQHVFCMVLSSVYV
jgi:hypothetical protein